MLGAEFGTRVDHFTALISNTGVERIQCSCLVLTETV